MAKLVVDLQRGLIEVDASEEVIKRVYSDVRDTILEKLAANSTRQEYENEGVNGTPQAPEERKTRKRARTGGPSCAARIQAIQDEGFFKEPKSAAAVREKLKERGTTYASKNIAASLTDLTKRAKLRRFNENGWKYQNP